MSNVKYKIKAQPCRKGSLLDTDPQIQLLNKLYCKDLQGFKNLLALDTVKVNYYYDHPHYKSCLQIACSGRGNSEFVKELIKHKADVNVIYDAHKRAPIHFAAEAGDEETVKELLKADGIDVDAMCKGNTALHLAIKQVEDIDEDKKNALRRYEDIVKLLVKAGSDVNIPDMKHITAVYSAARQGLEEMVKLMMKYSDIPLDLDSYADRKKKTARDMIKESLPHLLDKMPERNQKADNVDIHKLFSFLSSREEDKFVAAVKKIENPAEILEYLKKNNGLYTLLQFACFSGMDKAVSVLLENGAVPNLTAPGNSTRPVALALCGGYHKILKLLTDKDSKSLDPVNGDSLLQIVIKSEKVQLGNPDVDYKECMDILLSKPNSDINFPDSKGNTALHYAVKNGNQDTVLALLKRGAYIGIRNKFDEPPLADMSAKTYEAFLDECLTTNEKRSIDDDYEIKFDYSFLVPSSIAIDTDACNVPLMENPNATISGNQYPLAPETDALLYMTQHTELKPLLNHPLITSFLYLKWQRIRCLFYANIIFYALFWNFLTLYVLLDDDMSGKGDLTKGLVCLVKILTWVGLLVLLMREIFQMVVSPRLYFTSKENWLEMILVVVTLVILLKHVVNIEPAKRPLCAIVMLLSSTELVLLIGRFPRLSTYNEMLKTVSWNFYKIILFYGILIIAFALSLHIIFKKEKPETKEDDELKPFNPNKPADDDKEKDFFVNPGMSLIKTFVMLTGELDAASIDFESFPVISHLFFMFFVFMIPIVLFNLLNGLAVSDIQSIKANAEIVGHISRIKWLSYIENVVLGDRLPYWHKTCCWRPMKTYLSRMLYIKSLRRKVCLFPKLLPKFKIGVMANQNLRVIIYIDNLVDVESFDMVSSCRRSYHSKKLNMEGSIVKAARKIIIDREESQDSGCEIESRLKACEMKLVNVESLLEEIFKCVQKN